MFRMKQSTIILILMLTVNIFYLVVGLTYIFAGIDIGILPMLYSLGLIVLAMFSLTIKEEEND